MVSFLFYAILIILIANFIVDRWLEYLNETSISPSLPNELIGIYNEEKYQISVKYEKVTHRFTVLTESISFITILLFFVAGGFGWLDTIIRTRVSNPIFITLLFFAVLGLSSQIASLPFSWYSTFVIEEKFGFNKTTRRLFILDQIKGLIVSAIVGGVILAIIVWIYLIAGHLFWLYALLVIAFFSIFMLLFYSSLIVPLFNKQTPLPEGILKNAITQFSNATGFLLDNIYVIDGSKRSTKANAYFTGLGKKKRIVLFDTLINDLKTEEIVAVLAHEIGHNKKHHVYYGLFLSLVTTAIMLYIFSLVSAYPAFAEVLGSNIPSFHLSVISFGMLYSPLSLIIGLGMNVISRMNEYQADRFAAEKYSGEPLASALKKLSVNNLSNLTPHPAYVFFHYSHPTLLQRLKKLEALHKTGTL
ncbi:MAG: M48 family metallopeptidase [Mariniphaga sp.]